MTQGGPLSAKLFNILVDAVARKWLRQLMEDGDYKEAKLDEFLATFFAIFYVNNAYLALQDAEFLQCALDIDVGFFARVGLQTNTTKTQAMICTPGRIRTQLPVELYRRMHQGQVTAAKWNARPVKCCQCGKTMLASSLGRHLADVHDIYQLQMVAKELLEHGPPATYTVRHQQAGKLVCPFPVCEGILNNGWNLRRHFWDGCPSHGLGCGPVGGDISALPSVRDAS